MIDPMLELRVTMDALRAEVETLKSKLALMEEVVTVKREEDGRLSRSLECESLVVRDSVDPRCMAIHMGTNADNGTYLSVHYRGAEHGHKTAIGLVVRETNEPQIQMRGKDWKVRTGMWLDNDHGAVGVFRPGDVPAALMRALPSGGSLAVVQANGRARAALVHDEAKKVADGSVHSTTQLLLRGEDGVSGLNLLEDEGGALVQMNHGGASATLVTRKEAASLMMEGPEAATSVLMAAANEMARVVVQEGGATEQRASAALSAGSFGGDVSVREPSGTERVNLSAAPGSGRVSLLREDGEAGMSMFDVEGQFSQLEMRGVSAEPCVKLVVSERVAALDLASPLDPSQRVMVGAAETPSLLLAQEGGTRVALSVVEECGMISAYGPGGDKAGLAALSGGPVAGAVTVGSADGTSLVEIGASDHGGRIALNNDLGFQRIVMGVHEESAGMHLNHTGNDGVRVVATPMGGIVALCDAEGTVRTLLKAETEDEDDE